MFVFLSLVSFGLSERKYERISALHNINVQFYHELSIQNRREENKKSDNGVMSCIG